jgi:DNA-binding Xre family transcriptional regulator
MHKSMVEHNAPKHYSTQVFLHNADMHEATRANIQNLMAKAKKNTSQLAQSCSMQQSTLHRFLKGETATMELRNLLALAEYFGLTVSQLIGEVPFDPDPKIRAVTQAMEKMPEYKKDVLVAASATLIKPDPKNYA